MFRRSIEININKQSAVPYYQQIKTGLKALISTGDVKPGDLLPTEFNLSRQLGISRLVVNRAFRELVSEGVLFRKQARGTFVATPVKRSYMVTGPLFSMTENLNMEALEPSNQILVQEVIDSSEEIQNELGLPEGARVTHLRNLRLSKQIPFAIEEIYIPYDRFPAIADLDLNNSSVYLTLGKNYDAHPQEALDLVTAGLATVQEGKLLGVNKGAAGMRLKRTSTDRSGLTVEYRKVVFHSDRYRFTARLKRTG